MHRQLGREEIPVVSVLVVVLDPEAPINEQTTGGHEVVGLVAEPLNGLDIPSAANEDQKADDEHRRPPWPPVRDV
jgi:hypothetical protein